MKNLASSHGVTGCPRGSLAYCNPRRHGSRVAPNFRSAVGSPRTLCRTPVLSRALSPLDLFSPAFLPLCSGRVHGEQRRNKKTGFMAHNTKALKGMLALHLTCSFLSGLPSPLFLHLPPPFRSKQPPQIPRIVS